MHLILIAGSVLLAVVQLAGTYLLYRKNRAGWMLCVAANVIAIPYDALTVQYGFIIVSLINLVIAARAWSAWAA